MEAKRSYSGKDVDMLITIDTIMNAAVEHQEFLQSKRATWKDPYFPNIIKDIDTTIQTHLGKDNARQLRATTQAVRAIQTPALEHLAEFKVPIEADFQDNKTQRDEILNTLGFKAYNADAKKLDQEALINLLFQFRTNMTEELKETITNKGTATDLIDKITSYTDELRNANVIQEGRKGTKKEVTQEAIIDFNDVYKKAIAVSKIAANFFKDNKAVQDQFSFTKVRNSINNTRDKKEPN